MIMDFSLFSFPMIVAWMTVFMGILVKMLGFPDQFRINYKRKSTKWISPLFYGLSFSSYILWTLHGFFQGDMVLVVWQGLWVITTGMIIFQIILYKNK